MASLERQQVTINSRVNQAMARIGAITDTRVKEFAGDVSKMAKALLKEDIQDKEHSTGKLEESIAMTDNGELRAGVRTNADNSKGYGYGAPQEWGWGMNKEKKRDNKGRFLKQKAKGKHFMKRALFGMIKRWKRGDRWRD